MVDIRNWIKELVIGELEMDPIEKDLTIIRGTTFRGPSVIIQEGDYTSWSYAWKIRKKYNLPVIIEGKVEVLFRDFTLASDPETVVYPESTMITPYLDFGDTEELPLATGTTVGFNQWVYDLEMKDPEETVCYKVLKGKVNIIEEITY